MTERRFIIINTLSAGAVALAVFVGLRVGGMAGSGSASDHADSADAARPRVDIADVARLIRALKLVTVEITAPVRSESADRSWRGDVEASVTAPVRMFYGVDLSALADSGIRRDPLSGAWVLRVPKPRRLAIELLASDELPTVRVGGTRLRDVAGEYHLGQARVKLYERAHELVLSRDQAATVEQLTREQIASLVRTLLGENIPVQVEFDRTEITGVDDGSSPSTRSQIPEIAR